jgi:hypothetical protein
LFQFGHENCKLFHSVHLGSMKLKKATAQLHANEFLLTFQYGWSLTVHLLCPACQCNKSYTNVGKVVVVVFSQSELSLNWPLLNNEQSFPKSMGKCTPIWKVSDNSEQRSVHFASRKNANQVIQGNHQSTVDARLSMINDQQIFIISLEKLLVAHVERLLWSRRGSNPVPLACSPTLYPLTCRRVCMQLRDCSIHFQSLFKTASPLAEVSN